MEKRNIKNPTCSICGGVCSAGNRSSSTDRTAMFCHYCGQNDIISEKTPLCFDCKKKAEFKR